MMEQSSQSNATWYEEKYGDMENAEAINGSGDSGRDSRNHKKLWTINIHPTTGGQFAFSVDENETIDGLKKLISKKIKAPKEKLTLLYKEKILKQGNLKENSLSDECKLTLLPVVESGLLSSRQDQSIMQALENLTDDQVNDFLAGQSPLALALRLGDHMVFVQLQLASISPPKSPTAHTKCCCHCSSSSKQSTATATLDGCLPDATHQHTRPPPSCTSCESSSQKVSNEPNPASTALPASSNSDANGCTNSGASSSSSASAGAVIDSVKQHGPGIFSGTFSGSLSPAVQEPDGRPKRDVSTIVHILNDLLAAAPLYKQQLQQLPKQSSHHKRNLLRARRHYHQRMKVAAQQQPKPSADDNDRIKQENRALHNKLESLKMMMRARQERRRARREMQSPWTPTGSRPELSTTATAPCASGLGSAPSTLVAAATQPAPSPSTAAEPVESLEKTSVSDSGYTNYGCAVYQ